MRRLRGDRSQDALANDLSALGWDRGTVTAIETGRRRVKLEELAALCVVLGCSLADLLDGDSTVALDDVAEADLATVRRVLLDGGKNVKLTELGWKPPPISATLDPAELHVSANSVTADGGPTAEDIRAAGRGEAEGKAARRLNVDSWHVGLGSLELWGRSLTEERDARVAESTAEGTPARSVQALRGRVTRVLVDELRLWLEQRQTPGS